MSLQFILNDLPKDVEIVSPSLQSTVLYSGGLFFLDGVQVELTNDNINDLHSDFLLSDMSHFNEFKKGYFYEL